MVRVEPGYRQHGSLRDLRFGQRSAHNPASLETGVLSDQRQCPPGRRSLGPRRKDVENQPIPRTIRISPPFVLRNIVLSLMSANGAFSRTTLTIDDILSLRRLQAVQISPDGSNVVFNRSE